MRIWNTTDKKSVKKKQVLLFLIILLHCIGIIGLHTSYRNYFIVLTPWNLVVTFVCLLTSFNDLSIKKIRDLILVGLAGFAVELIGVQTGFLFGTYSYGSALGYQLLEVPLLIMVNWVLLIWGASAVVVNWKISLFLKALLVAVMLTAFDWIMEPVAVSLGYWSWKVGAIPFYNYLCWFVCSFAFSYWILKHKTVERNQVSIGILVVFVLFFAILR